MYEVGVLCCLFVASTSSSSVYLCVDVDGSVFLCKKKVCDAFRVAVKSMHLGWINVPNFCSVLFANVYLVSCLLFVCSAANTESFTMPSNATPLPPWIEKGVKRREICPVLRVVNAIYVHHVRFYVPGSIPNSLEY